MKAEVAYPGSQGDSLECNHLHGIVIRDSGKGCDPMLLQRHLFARQSRMGATIYANEEDLEQLYKSFASEILMEYVRSGTLTATARDVALSELKSRGIEEESMHVASAELKDAVHVAIHSKCDKHWLCKVGHWLAKIVLMEISLNLFVMAYVFATPSANRWEYFTMATGWGMIAAAFLAPAFNYRWLAIAVVLSVPLVFVSCSANFEWHGG